MKLNTSDFYWQLWGVAVLVLVLIKLIFGKGLDKVGLFVIFSIYMVPVWLWVMYLNYRKGRDLMSYLKEYHRAKWEELTYIPYLGHGNRNNIKTFPFVYSSDNLSDETVRELKNSCKKIINFMLVVLVLLFNFF